MILFAFLAIGILVLAFIYLWDSGMFRKTKKFDATVVDESEDEVFDNTGGVKIRFYKVYEYFNGEENIIVKSERPMKKIDDDVNRKCVIYVDVKNRKAMEKKDIVRYRLYAMILILLALGIFALMAYVKIHIQGALV